MYGIMGYLYSMARLEIDINGLRGMEASYV